MIREDEILVLYQPQMAAFSDRMVGVECLVRWNHPSRGHLGPGDFLPAIENDEHKTQSLCEWVLRRACKEALHWTGLSVAVNVSPIQFRIADFAERLVAIAADEGFPLGRLEFEMLETAYFEDQDNMKRVLSYLRSKGISIALDDFGTGYSSLSAVLDMPLDKLKIDGTFAQKCHTLKGASIIHGITALGRALGLKILAEGVETEAQRKILKSAGCQLFQGYLFSKPVSSDEIRKLIQASPILRAV